MKNKLQKIQIEISNDFEKSNPYFGREGLVYARVSSKRQETEGSGLDSQEKRCLDDLRTINVPHHRTFRDSFSGGGDFMRRPAMREMLSYIDANPHRKFVVVFDDISRFARDVIFHLKLRTEFKAREVLLRCPNYNFDESEEGEFVELIFAGKAELDRKQNRRQVIQKMKARMELGYWPFSRKRGYDTVQDVAHGKILVPNKEGETVMREALEGFASARFIRKVDVARYLHKNSFWKKSKRPAEKYIDEVTEMLTDVVNCGDVEYLPWGVTRRKGRHQGIISIAAFEMIQRRLKKEDSKVRVRMDISPEFPLRGLILCPGCNAKMTGAPSKGRPKQYPYYYCWNKKCELYGKTRRKADVERDFESLLNQTRLKDDVSDVVQEIFDRVWKEEIHFYKQEESKKENQKQFLEQKVRDLTELARVTRSDVLRQTYEKQIEEVATAINNATDNTKRDLGVPYRTALSKATGMLKNPINIWGNVDVNEKHRLFYFLFEAKIPYSKEEGFRTAKKLSVTRIFEEFCDENSDTVDSRGFEPLTSRMPCARSTN